jgi:hypothetical protein
MVPESFFIADVSVGINIGSLYVVKKDKKNSILRFWIFHPARKRMARRFMAFHIYIVDNKSIIAPPSRFLVQVRTRQLVESA